MIGLSYGRSDVAAVGLAASLCHVLNHAVFKGLLFLAAGGVLMETGTRQIEQLGGLLRRMPWTGLWFLIGAMAISGLPPLNGFASEWLTFQALLFGFRGSADPLVHVLFPVGGALLALTTALAAACFVKAFGMTFVALPRSPSAADARESSMVILAPQAWLAVCCVGLGLFPGFVLRALERDGHLAWSAAAWGRRAGRVGHGVWTPSTMWSPSCSAWPSGCVGSGWVAECPPRGGRRVPTWGCGGQLTARTECTATAFSKPLMMIFRAVYRPTREVEALTETSPYFPREVRYRSEIEPTFERHVYGPVIRTVLRVATGMRVLQAGSLHAYLGYVIALVVSLVLFVWWTR